jgi:alanine racemase
MAVVKANGYGHGLAQAARSAILGGATWLGVASAEEGMELRSAGIDIPVLVLGYTPPAAVADALRLELALTVYDRATVSLLSRIRAGLTGSIHVKVDTGMHRLGASPKEAVELACAVHATPGLKLQGFFTHFADADAADETFTLRQLESFLEARQVLLERGVSGFLSHAANSAALLRFPESRLDLVRAGLVVYGISPFGADLTATLESGPTIRRLQPALRWRTIVTNVQTIDSGEGVGYGRTFRARKPSRIATLAVGYADGLHRTLSNRGMVIVRGRLAPIAGTISMDQAAADVTEIPGVQVGDVVTLIGSDDQAVWEAADVARVSDTIPYEILCAIGPRVTRRYLDPPDRPTYN